MLMGKQLYRLSQNLILHFSTIKANITQNVTYICRVNSTLGSQIAISTMKIIRLKK